MRGVKRNDCEERYKVIKKDYGDFTNKSLIDYGCAEGYLSFRFLQDGGRYVYGVEIEDKRREIIREVSNNENLNFEVDETWKKDCKFDVCFFLDLFLHAGVDPGVLEKIHRKVKVAYISPSGQGRNQELEANLEKYWCNYEKIYTGYCDRNIYRCLKCY